jgi:hypothetical protein
VVKFWVFGNIFGEKNLHFE